MLSIRWRLTLFHAAAILVIAGVFIAILVVVSIRGVMTSVRETTRARAVEAVQVLESGVAPTDPTLARLSQGDVYLLIRDSSGQVLAEIGVPSNDIEDVGAADRDAVWQSVLASNEVVQEDPAEMFVYAAPVAANPSGAVLVEAWKSFDDFGENIIPFVVVTTFGVPVGLVLAIAGSYLLARSALSPVDAIVRAARDISERDLSRRLPVQRPHDELGRLATTFNDLLGRLDVAFHQREETLHQQRRFVADASHELRTPLTSIQGYARMLGRWALVDPETARESVAAIEREAMRMQALVDGLLRLARGDEGVVLDRTATDLRELAIETLERVQAGAGQDWGWSLDVPDRPVSASVDREAMTQAIAILLDNALKYTPPGGHITITVREADGMMEVTVADTGIGIDATHLPHIFDRFYRVDEARATGGTGLGLAIARQIVRQHDGDLNVVSKPGTGSTFVLTIPTPREDGDTETNSHAADPH